MRIPLKFTPVIDVALDTIALQKQAIVFVNSKNSAEKQAEDISKKLPATQQALAEKIEKVLSTPTKQCTRLASCVQKGTAFHHAGLHQKQRELIEDAFREGSIKIICATPTLAAGVDLPAYRAVLKDLKRYTFRGLQYIPVLEYMQMAGRAGRPSYDTEGQAICLASTRPQAEELTEIYLHGKPEEITSKLAAEPVLRTYALSLLVTDVARSKEELLAFFKKTFFGHQYGDSELLSDMVSNVLRLLDEWEFVKGSKDDFMSADNLDERYKPTVLGKRVAELYVDPYTAHQLLERLQKKERTTFGYMQALAHTLEMRPLLRVKQSEVNHYEDKAAMEDLLEDEPFDYDEYAEYLNSVKTASFLMDWMDEHTEDELLAKYGIRPGEIRAKQNIVDWLIMSAKELAGIQLLPIRNDLAKLRLRLKHGAKEELLPLLKLKQVGRARARKLFNAGIKNVADVKKADPTTLQQLMGKKIAENIIKQRVMG